MLRRTVCSSSPLRVSEGVVAFCVLERRILVSYCQYHRSKANTVYGYGYFDYWGKGTLVTVTSGCYTPHCDYYGAFDYWGKGTMVTVTSDGPSHRPAVFLLSPSPQESTNGNGEVSLTCFVKDFYPEEVYITWLHSDNAVPQTFYTTTNLIPKKNGNPLFSVYSKLTVPTQEWTDGGIYTCVVYHETIQPPTRMITRNADSTGKQTLVNVGLTLPDKANPCSN
ncbi:UNVERIFIED_CONTAM: hypothetical protein FKN15_029903 [Acipenser sinensis]